MKYNRRTYCLTDDKNIAYKSLAIGIISLLASVAGYLIDRPQFYYSYLVAFVFWLTLALGGLFFVMLHHLANATWSVVLRRIAENLMTMVPIAVIFFIPIAFGLKHLYPWSQASIVAADELLHKKIAYLNTPFFITRAVLYLIVWYILTRILYKTSLAQDKNYDENQIPKFRQVSAIGMILFAITLTFASFDWLLSLDAHWYSTIFGVYIFAGSVLAGLVLITLTAIILRKKEVLADVISFEHYHDLGKLIFTFVVFWAYIAFSQYFLIWYANIPEETIWFASRWHGQWTFISLLIVFGHFVVPFFVLITQTAKRNLTVLTIISIWLLFIHWVDLYWIVLPNLYGAKTHLSWMDLTTMAGIGGVFIWYFIRRLSAQPLIPINDNRLETSIKIMNG
jgi:hypothetical protein